uniref:rRNA-processing protein FCF1 homolog n=1 Tax=Cyprinus carpio TaxID=7962 RepID=A0A8C1M8T4_CYPCA
MFRQFFVLNMRCERGYNLSIHFTLAMGLAIKFNLTGVFELCAHVLHLLQCLLHETTLKKLASHNFAHNLCPCFFSRKEQDRAKTQKKKKEDPSVIKEKEVAKYPSCMFFQYNTQLGPPYYILVDTNFINFSIKAKLDVVQSMMDCLYAKCVPCITDCVMAELEKLGMKFRVALRIAKDPRFDRLPCSHKGTYADDCLVQRVMQHKCYIVATVDRDLKRRIRKIPGVPIMYISNHRYNIERMPDDYGAPRL